MRALKPHGTPSEAKALVLELINALIANQATLNDAAAVRTQLFKLGLFGARTRLRTEAEAVVGASTRSGGDELSSAGDSSSSSSSSSSQECTATDDSSFSSETRQNRSGAKFATRVLAALNKFDDHTKRDEYELLHYGRRASMKNYLAATRRAASDVRIDSASMSSSASDDEDDGESGDQRTTAAAAAAASAAADDSSSLTNTTASDDDEYADDDDDDVASRARAAKPSGDSSPSLRGSRRRKHKKRAHHTRPQQSAPAAPGVARDDSRRTPPFLRVVIVSPLASGTVCQTVVPIEAMQRVDTVVTALEEKFPFLRSERERHALFLPEQSDTRSGTGAGQWLDAAKTFGEYRVDANVTAEFRLQPWRFSVVLFGDLNTRRQTLLDAEWMVAAAVRHAERDLGVAPDEHCDYGLFVVRDPLADDADELAALRSYLPAPRTHHHAAAAAPSEPEAPSSPMSRMLRAVSSRPRALSGSRRMAKRSSSTSGSVGGGGGDASGPPSADELATQSNAHLRELLRAPSAQQSDADGVWLDDVKSLHHYADLLRHRDQLLLVVRPRPRPYLVSFVAGQLETVTLDPASLVLDAKTELAEQLLTSEQRRDVALSDYCLFLGNSDAPLDETVPLRMARVPPTTALRLAPRPVTLRVQLPDESEPRAVTAQLAAPLSALVTKLCGQFDLMPADWRAYDVMHETSAAVLDGGESDAPRRKRKRRRTRLQGTQTLREQHVAADSLLRLSRNEAVTAASEAIADADDAPMWPEPPALAPDVLLGADGQLRAGSLNALIRYLTSPDDYDRQLMSTFLATYQSFTRPRRLLRRLVERFDVPADVPEKVAATIRVRVSVFLKNWIESSIDDFLVPDNVLSELQTFCGTKLSTSMGPGLLRQIEKALSDRSAQQARDAQLQQPLLRQRSASLERIGVLDLDARTLAEQLTYEAYRRFERVRSSDFFVADAAVHLPAFIDFFNDVAGFVTTVILSEAGLRRRAKVMAFTVKVAVELRALNNFHLLMAFVSAWNNSAVARLKWTREKLSRKHFEQLQTLETLMSVSGSFKNYREAFAQSTPPLLPYMGVHLQDLTFIGEGNPATLDNLINWEKQSLVYASLNAVLKYQRIGFVAPLEERTRGPKGDVVLRFVLTLPRLSDEEAYQASLKLEPRSCDPRSLKQ